MFRGHCGSRRHCESEPSGHQEGIRLLEVNGMDVSRSQKTDVVGLFRNGGLTCTIRFDKDSQGYGEYAKSGAAASGYLGAKAHKPFGSSVNRAAGRNKQGEEQEVSTREAFKQKLEQTKAAPTPIPAKSVQRKKVSVGNWFNTLRRKKLQKGSTIDNDVEVRVVERTMEWGGASEFESCTAGQMVSVLRELPDHTVVIQGSDGTQLLHGDAFIKPEEHELDDLDMDMFGAGTSA